jgi:NAD(P)-dependent dehydrogenase (short-subunit alcohol dehydrogenase family)
MALTAMIWGATGGIGRALLAELVDQNWTVIAVGRHTASQPGVAQISIEAEFNSAYHVQMAVTEASQHVTEVNLWAYAAGDIHYAKVAELSPPAWQQTMDANVTGAFLATHYSLPLLAADAHLFYLGAIHERLRLPGFAAYAAAKAGLEAFADALRKERRQQRITVVRPSAVDTAFWRKVPLRLPNGALSPQAVAQQMLAAYHQQLNDNLDLTART